MSLADLDPVLNQPKRLACLGAAGAARAVEFAALRDHLGLSDSDLSKQLKILVDEGYLDSRKTGKGANRRTWLSITKRGRTALAAHVEALRKLAAPVGVDADEPATGRAESL